MIDFNVVNLLFLPNSSYDSRIKVISLFKKRKFLVNLSYFRLFQILLRYVCKKSTDQTVAICSVDSVLFSSSNRTLKKDYTKNARCNDNRERMQLIFHQTIKCSEYNDQHANGLPSKESLFRAIHTI